MKKYLVGGAVRDRFIATQIKDHDWVWTGATPQDMEGMGFKQVGADFPVFLDDKGEEHALARTERKTGPGYNGFDTRFDPSVTIEDDLLRRDLTMNAMAICVTDDPDYLTVIDPFNGQQDIRDGVLRHVSEAFREDPVRILRIARFAARYNFKVEASTMLLMQEMVEAGEVDHLTAERVWAEMDRAIMEDHAPRFFEVLHQCGALARIFGASQVTVHGLGQLELKTELSRIRLSIGELRTACALNFSKSWMRWIALAWNHDAANLIEELERFKAPKEVTKKIEQALDLLWMRDAHKRDPGLLFSMFKNHRLNLDQAFDNFRETASVLAQIGFHSTTDLIRIVEALSRARAVTSQSVILKYAPGEAPTGKDLGDAISAEQKNQIRKYFNE